MLKIKIGDKEYTKVFKSVEWSGGINGTSRILRVSYVKEEVKLEVGDPIEFYVDDIKVFVGRIFEKRVTTEEITAEFVAYDASIYLNKNKFVKNYFNRVPSEIVKEICQELSLKVGELPQDGVKCSYPAINRSGYEILLIAYTIQHNKDKKIYSIVCNSDKIEVVNEDIFLELELHSKYDIRSAKYQESIKDMINQMIVYKTEKEKRQIIEKVANEEDKKKYGLFQNVIQYHKDMNNIFNAKDMLKGKDQTASIVVNGNINLQSGYSVGVNEHTTGLVGTFYIQSDKHVWTGDQDYETFLELGFEKVMDKVEFDEVKRKIKTQYSLTEGVDREVIK